MQEKRKVLVIEKSLGFLWRWGFSRKTSLSSNIPVVRDLLYEIGLLKEQFLHLVPNQLRASADFKHLCEDLFQKHGPRLWPSPPIDTSTWLVDARKENWDGLYPKNLYYDLANDRDILRRHFHNLMYEKCTGFYENRKQKDRRQQKAALAKPPWEESDHETDDASETPSKDFSSFDLDFGSESDFPSSRSNSTPFQHREILWSVPLQAHYSSCAPVAPMFATAEPSRPAAGSNTESTNESVNAANDMGSRGHTTSNPDVCNLASLQTAAPSVTSDTTSLRPTNIEHGFPAPQPYNSLAHKHHRSCSSEIEIVPSKRPRLSQLNGLVKLKIDPVRLAEKLKSISQGARNTPYEYRVARKTTLSGAIQPELIPRTGQTQITTASSPSDLNEPLQTSSEIVDRASTRPLNDIQPKVRCSIGSTQPQHSLDDETDTIRLATAPLSTNEKISSDPALHRPGPAPEFNRPNTHVPSAQDRFQPIRPAPLQQTRNCTPTNGTMRTPSASSPDLSKNMSRTVPQQPTSAAGFVPMIKIPWSVPPRLIHTSSTTMAPSQSLPKQHARVTGPTAQPGHEAAIAKSIQQIRTSQSANPTPAVSAPETIDLTKTTSEATAGSAVPFKQFTVQLGCRPGTAVITADRNDTTVRPGETRPTEARPAEQRPAEPKSAEPEPAGPDPAEPKSAEPKPSETKSAETEPSTSTAETAEALKPPQEREAPPSTPIKEPTALEEARTEVYWDEDDLPSFISLRLCKTHDDLFTLLRKRRPKEMKHKSIEMVEVRLANASEAGMTRNPNCRIDADDDNDGFEYLIGILGSCTANVRPELVVTVYFED